MNQSINTDSKNSKELQQKYRLGTVSIKLLGGLNPVKPVMDLIPVWQCDRNWSKILCGTIPNPVHDLKVKVTEFLYKSFVLFFCTISVFCKAFNGFESCLA